jgi:hypothetical protein
MYSIVDTVFVQLQLQIITKLSYFDGSEDSYLDVPTPCSLVGGYLVLRETPCLHFQSKISFEFDSFMAENIYIAAL